ANQLYLSDSDYGQPAAGKPLLTIAAWPQYVLDNYATVAEAVAALSKEPFSIVSPTLPNGSKARLHLSISDASGDSAIFEYVEGKLEIHHGKQYVVMTNQPIYEKQLAMNEYWESIGGLKFLPGTFSPADRFARASFLVGAIPRKADPTSSRASPINPLSSRRWPACWACSDRSASRLASAYPPPVSPTYRRRSGGPS